MKLEKALQLKVGDIVYCPNTRLGPAHRGEIVAIGSRYGDKPLIVHVKHPKTGAERIWTSDKLGT